MPSLMLFLEEGPFRVAVDPNLGGHVIEYSINGRNALAENKPAIGSTFWPAPQSEWDWPPPATLDNEPYSILRQGDELVLVSGVCKQTGLSVEKRFQLHRGRLSATYTMRNEKDVAVQYAPWEISRVTGGITFYQSATAPLEHSTGRMELVSNVFWHVYQPEKQLINEKIFGNGSAGWLANLNNGLLLVKQFDPVPAELTAPGEAEVEIYGHGDVFNSYVEVEQQGAFSVIPPGEQISWKVIWHLAEWKGSSVSIGDENLVEAAKMLLVDYDSEL